MTWTVDFRFDGGTFSIAGESSVLLSEVFSRLSVGREAADVVSCEFNDPELLSVKREGDDWRLASLAPFSTEERLSCTFPDGDVVEIRVTDAWYIRGGDSSSFMGLLPFATSGINYSALMTSGSNVQFSTTNSANFGLGYLRPNTNYSSATRSLYISGSFPANRNTSIPGSATLTFKNAAMLADGSLGDVRITFSNVQIRPRQKASIAALYSNGTLFAFGWNGGTPVSHTQVVMSIQISIVNGSGNETFIWACRDLDQADYTSGKGSYGGWYAESFRVNGGSVAPAYITAANFLKITSNGDASATANGLKFTATRLDSETFNSGFATEFANSANLDWWGSFCGTQIGVGVLNLGYRPNYRTYSNGSLSTYMAGSTGGTVNVYDPATAVTHPWRGSDRYSYLWYGNGKSGTVSAQPATGYYLASASQNGSPVAMPGNSLALSNLQTSTTIDAYFSPITGTVTIKKADASTGEPLAGAEFTCSGTSSVHGAFSLTSTDNGDGTYTIANVPYGRASDAYTVSETQVPAGYEVAPDQTVAGDAFAAAGAVVELSFEDAPTAPSQAPFSFVKVDRDGAPLAGAAFELYACPAGCDHSLWPLASAASEAAGCWVVSSPFRRAVSGPDGTVDFGELPAGAWMLAETEAPAGLAAPYGQWLVEVDPRADPRVRIAAHASPAGDMPPAFRPGPGAGALALPNYPNVSMPRAGGRGALAATAAGVCLLGAAAALALSGRRRA